MNIFPVKTDADYRNALAEIEGLMAAKLDSPEGDRLDVLVTLVEAYEARNFPMEMPDPIEAIRFRMEQSGYKPTDMVGIFGATHRFYEVMGGKRSLSLGMIRRLYADLGIPADVLIQETAPEAAKPARRLITKAGKSSRVAEAKKAIKLRRQATKHL